MLRQRNGYARQVLRKVQMKAITTEIEQPVAEKIKLERVK